MHSLWSLPACRAKFCKPIAPWQWHRNQLNDIAKTLRHRSVWMSGPQTMETKLPRVKSQGLYSSYSRDILPMHLIQFAPSHKATKAITRERFFQKSISVTSLPSWLLILGKSQIKSNVSQSKGVEIKCKPSKHVHFSDWRENTVSISQLARWDKCTVLTPTW